MHESHGRDGQDGRKRSLNTKLNARGLTALLLALAVVFAGCTGFGGLGGGDAVAEADTPGGGTADGSVGNDATTAASGDGDGDGSDSPDGDSTADSANADTDTDAADSSGADDSEGDASSVFGEDPEAAEDWFNLSRPGHYAFDLAGMDTATGEQVTGRLVYDVEVADGDELTMSVDYEFGGEQFQSSTTAPADEFSAQLFLNEAYAPIGTLQSVSLMYLLEMGFTDPSVGNRKQSSTEEGTRITEATEERTYAGIDCVFVETTLNDTLSQEACLPGSDGGLAPYAAIYTDEGDLELEVELVEYERR